MDILRPVVRIEDLLEQVVADAIARGMSEDDVWVWLGSLARMEYRRQEAGS